MTTCHAGNYQPGRTEAIRYLAIHYTAGKNDTAEQNVRYFAENVVRASAHYFVDPDGWRQSVDDGDTAWAVGTAGEYVQKHPYCRNGNSLSIELCCLYRDGTYSFDPRTVANAAALARTLMKKYRIPPENVLRHWDVVSKVCPEPWVRDEAGWLDFQKRLREEDTVEDEKTPDAWAKEAAEWAVQAGLMEDGNWRAPLTREAAAVILYRYAKK